MMCNKGYRVLFWGIGLGLGCMALRCENDDALPPIPSSCSTGHPCYQLALAQCECCPSQSLCEQTVKQLCDRDALVVGAKSVCSAKLPFDVSQCESLNSPPGTVNLICFGQEESIDDVVSEPSSDSGETSP